MLSPDRKWLVCVLRLLHTSIREGNVPVRVWDAQTHEEVLDIKGHINAVFSVDIPPDSTRFVTSSANMYTGRSGLNATGCNGLHWQDSVMKADGLDDSRRSSNSTTSCTSRQKNETSLRVLAPQ